VERGGARVEAITPRAEARGQFHRMTWEEIAGSHGGADQIIANAKKKPKQEESPRRGAFIGSFIPASEVPTVRRQRVDSARARGRSLGGRKDPF